MIYNLDLGPLLFAYPAVIRSRWANEALKVRPDRRPTYETLAACYAATEDMDEAKRASSSEWLI
jgi:hypothetical protein